MTPATQLVLFRRLALFGVLLTLVVVVLGAWVRLSAAGLGCPDWPGCYGHITAGGAEKNLEHITEAFPERPFEYTKALKEMVHRYFASTLGFLCVVLAGMAIANRKHPEQPVALPIFLVVLVIFQGLLGMWTVTLLLKPLIVTLHLIGGLSTLSVLAWLAMRSRGSNAIASTPSMRSKQGQSLHRLKQLALVSLAVLSLQIILGGWTSTNYAALACPDFPKCQDSYWPEMDAKDAFVLWRGLGIDYEGGVLDHPARVAIHFVHRLGAIVTALVLGFTAFFAWRHGNAQIRTAGALMASVLLTQLILGPIMVMRALPLELATAHNGVAAVLLLSLIRLVRVVRRA
jgi:cytochrome c oxidase assembly protein subunit 15